MKIILLFCFLLVAATASAQLVFPKGFNLIAGENLAGDDDIYTNGNISFITHKIFRTYDFKGNDESVKRFVSHFFNIPFALTKDGLCWGTGKTTESVYSYIVVTFDAEVIELYAKKNDSEFAFYSKWLLATIRQYKKEGKAAIFPIRKE